MSPNQPQFKEIVWDGDNTLWNWTRYASRGYQAMCDTLCERTGKPEEDVASAMKSFYGTTGTLENSLLVQGLEKAGFFKGLQGYDQKEMIDAVKKSYSDVRRRYLKRYIGIKEVVEEAHSLGIKNTLITDAPKFHAMMRLIRSGLAPYFQKVVAQKSVALEEFPEHIQEGVRKIKFPEHIQIIEVDEEKPMTELDKYVSVHDIETELMISGDNDGKDMELVRKWGCFGIHALWGAAAEEDIALLKKFSAPQIANKNTQMIQAQISERTGKIVQHVQPSEMHKYLKAA